jgi:hypothetical protein
VSCTRPMRTAWVVPAVIAAAAIVAVLGVLRLAQGPEDDGITRQRISAAAGTPTGTPAQSDPAQSGPAGGTAGATGGAAYLQGDGLGVVRFGDRQDTVVATLTARLRPPDEQTDEPCRKPPGTSHWVRWADLSVRFDGGAFVGYLEGIHYPPSGPPVDFGTKQGLSPGDPIKRVQQIIGTPFRLRAQPDHPGQQPVALVTIDDGRGHGGMTGVIEGKGSARTLTAIFAGSVC